MIHYRLVAEGFQFVRGSRQPVSVGLPAAGRFSPAWPLGASQSRLAVGGMLLRFAVLLLAPAVCAADSPSAVPSAPLTSIASIRSLPSRALQEKRPARVNGVVILYDADNQLFFVQDDTAGIYVWGNPSTGVSVGDRIEVEGTTMPGRFSPVLALASLRTLGSGALPAPRKVQIEELNAGLHDSQWIEIDGVVQRQNIVPGSMILTVSNARSQAKAVFPGRFEPGFTNLVGAQVTLCGVGTAQVNEHREIREFPLWVPNLRLLKVHTPAPADHFQAPRVTLGELQAYEERQKGGRMVTVQGTVWLHWPGSQLIVGDAESAVRVQPSPTNALAPGQLVEVAAFPSWAGMAPVLTEALVRTNSAGATNRLTIAAELRPNHRHVDLVRVEGVLRRDSETAGAECGAWIESGSHRLLLHPPDALTAARLADLPTGGRVRLVGVAEERTDRHVGEPGWDFWLRDSSDLLTQPSPHFGWFRIASPLLLGAALAGLATLGVARRRWQRLLRQTEQRLRLMLEERERLARDLHDEIIQSLYAVGLGLEDCRRLLGRQQTTEAHDQLARCREEINALVKEIRSFIGGLQVELLEGSELEGAIRSLVVLLGQGAMIRFLVRIDPETAVRLSPRQATHLLHIARESMSNCVRHARAKTATVQLRAEGDLMRFEVIDDGVGFDPATANPVGLGLRNIRARADELRAAFELNSIPGGGTTLAIVLSTSDSISKSTV